MTKQMDFRMLLAQMDHILKHSKTTYIAVTVAELLILAGLWSANSHIILLIWLGGMQLVGISHVMVCSKCMDKELAEKPAHRLRMFLIYNALVTGLLWGSLAWLAGGAWDIHTFFILLPIMGIFAGAMNKASILPVYFALVIPILVQSLAVLLLTDAANLVLAGFFAIYYAGMIRFSIELHKMLKHNYSLQFELETTNAELLIQKQVAEKANIDKSRFLASASHDLRQPLYAMELFLGGLVEDHDDSKKAYLLSRLRSALGDMQSMFSSLLDMSRFDAGVITPVKKNFSENWLLQSVHNKFEGECRNKGLRLRARPCNRWAFSDPILIQRVLENFVSNAIKYTDSGGVLVVCRKRGDCLRFEVWDTGRGIRAEDIEHVFDAFHQLDNPERDRRKGVGLGLSIVEQISKLLKAPVSVRSTFGKGSVFTIEVPVGEAVQEPALETGEYLPVDMEAFVDLEVWIVDDDIDILEGLELQLETWGCITRTFESPDQLRDAMDKLDAAPGLLLSDLRLRNHKNGIEVIEMVRAYWKQAIPSIIITGDTGPEQLKETSSTGCPVLHKPAKAEELKRAITEVLP